MKRILLINWDNYPNIATGGIYSWARAIIEGLPNNEFIVLNWISNPNTNAKYALPANVIKVMDIPLFGTFRHQEFYRENKKLISTVWKSRASVIESEFLPLYEDLIAGLLAINYDHGKVKNTIVKIHNFMKHHDVKECLEYYKCWDTFRNILSRDSLYSNTSLREAQIVYAIIQRIIQVISIDLPKCDIIHSSLAWFPAMAAIPALASNNCPFMVTEHGVAFSLLSLYTSSYMYGESSGMLWKFFCANVIKSVYTSASKVYPVCRANVTWEHFLGVKDSRIKIIYNGVNTDVFKPLNIQRGTTRPTIVYVGRIEIFKDLITLLHAIKYSKTSFPEIQCLIYGSCDDSSYARLLVNTVTNLQLHNNVKFMGKTSKPAEAYDLADIVVLSSITEGFPFSIIEAMACGKPIVATDVGGVSEALLDCGILVKPRHPKEFSQAIVNLLKDTSLRSKLANNSLERARSIFSRKLVVQQYDKEYEQNLVERNIAKVSVSEPSSTVMKQEVREN